MYVLEQVVEITAKDVLHVKNLLKFTLKNGNGCEYFSTALLHRKIVTEMN